VCAFGAALTLGYALAVAGRPATASRRGAPVMIKVMMSADAEQKKLVKQMEEQRRQFDAQVAANKLKREKEQAKALEKERQLAKAVQQVAATRKAKAAKAATSATRATSATKTASARTTASVQERQAEAERKKRAKEMEDQRRQFEKQVEAAEKLREKQRELDNKFYAKQAAAIAAGKPVPVRKVLPPPKALTPVKANAAQQPSKVTVAKQTSEETPAKAFERIFAPIFIPPSVAAKRPELVSKYQSSGTTSTPRAKTVTKKAVAKKVVAKKVVAKRPPAKKVVAKKVVTKRASGTVRGVVKPTRVTKRAIKKTTTEGESLSKLFDNIFAKK
jgi:hypothetical protein